VSTHHEKTERKEVTKARPCELCEAEHGCSRSPDGFLFCRKRQGPVPGFRYLGQAKGDSQWGMYRREDDTGQHHGHGKAGDNGKPPEDWGAKVRGFARNMTDALWRQLAEALGLPEAVLRRLPGIGYSPKPLHKAKPGEKPFGPCFTFPEVDPLGRPTGIGCRYLDGRKRSLWGGARGLTVVPGLLENLGPILVAEGASCTLTGAALGLAVLGRWCSTGGVECLAELLKPQPKDRPVIVLAEHDSTLEPHYDGTYTVLWPGRDGAVAVAAKLEQLLGRAVHWCFPPGGQKDLRSWFLAQAVDLASTDALHDCGRRFLQMIADKERRGQPPQATAAAAAASTETPRGLVTTCLAAVKPEPVRWLVPDYIPLGKLVLVAGDGGHGKSVVTLDLATGQSLGRPCLGLDYEPPPAADVLLVNCEDDVADTVVPRLLAAGADLRHVFQVGGVEGKDGKPAPFSLAHYQQVEEELRRRPGVRLVVIDPAGAYVGATGVDDHKDSELRSLLGPLAELAARARVTVVLVKHLTKGTTPKAVYRVSGSAGYINSLRAGFVVAPDGDDEHKKLFLPIKFNLGPKPVGLAYRLLPLGQAERDAVIRDYGGHLGPADQQRLADQLFRVAWLGAVDVDADRLFAEQSRRDRGPGRVRQAADWLEGFLGAFAYPSDEILAAGLAKGFSFDNVKDAKVLLKAEGLQSSNKGQFAGVWWSGFGPPEAWKRRPEPPAHCGESGSRAGGETPHFPHNGRDSSAATTYGDGLFPHYGHSGEPTPHNGDVTETPAVSSTSGEGPSIVGKVGSLGSAPQTGDQAADDDSEVL
jgi:hypothetical protein